MINQQFVKLLYDVADVLELQQVPWKPEAYRKAARAIEAMQDDLAGIFESKGKKGLEEIPGVGSGIADHIIEYIKKGKVQRFLTILKKAPKGYTELLEIEGLGPRKVKILTEKLGIKNLVSLSKALEEHKLRNVAGFGEVSEQNLLKSLALHELGRQRMLLGRALPLAEEIIAFLKMRAQLQQIQYAGSLRRMKETIGDIDILVVSSEAAKVTRAFTHLPSVKRVLASGKTKSSIILKEGVHVDLRILPRKSYGAALQYFTGSKDHNIALRNIAIKKGYKLSEYGLFSKKTGEQVAGATEEEVYSKLGFSYVPPELRESAGELEAAQKGKLPKLIEAADIRGDLHVHTKLSDGTESIEAMVAAAQKLGYEYIAITDHSPSERIAHGLEIDRLKQQWKQIDALSRKYKIRVLKGSEIDIRADGTLDYPDEILRQLHIAVCSIHSRFKSSEQEMTQRICSALENKYLDILGHPSGRLIGQREPYEADFAKIFDVAAQNKKVVEINSQLARLDLNGSHIRIAKEYGLLFSIDTDSHASTQLLNMRYGVAQARRGWLTKADVVNTLPLTRLRKVFRRIPDNY
ncbi:DNA polymerase/3'-5' exonuclease PolX [Candidatus Woesearchaeota archaeon]|nr:DNA polymerase/3'-5' exonuclease PolX [Candidatus Woesearchaeota archaeon]